MNPPTKTETRTRFIEIVTLCNIIVIILACVAASWGLWPWLIKGFAASWEPALTLKGELTWGDAYNILSCGFAGFAFAGLNFTLLLQIQDGKKRDAEAKKRLNRQQIEDDRWKLEAEEKRLAADREQLERNTEAKRRIEQRTLDQFETTFFRLIAFWKDYVSSMSLNGMGQVAIKNLCESFRSTVQSNMNAKHDLKLYIRIYDDSFRNINASMRQLFPYFRMLYHVFKYLDNAPIPELEKPQYSDIVRALLSTEELQLLAVNCLGESGEKFKPLVEKFHLLKHMDKGDHINPNEPLIREFKETAFSDPGDEKTGIIKQIFP